MSCCPANHIHYRVMLICEFHVMTSLCLAALVGNYRPNTTVHKNWTAILDLTKISWCGRAGWGGWERQKRLALMAAGFPVIQGRVGKFQESKHESKQNMLTEWISNIGKNSLKILITGKGVLALEPCISAICDTVWSLYISQAANTPLMFRSAFYMMKKSLSVRVSTAAKIILYEGKRMPLF